MNFIEGYSHRNGNVEWEKRELDEWLTYIAPHEGPGAASSRTVPLDAESIDRAEIIGCGNVSAGIREALRIVTAPRA